MSLTAALSRVASTLVTMLHTRLELIGVELEEELLRFSSYFIYCLIALFCGSVAVLLFVFLIISLFWDDHRIAALVSLSAFFGAICLFMTARLWTQIRDKPRLLEQSVAELKKDAELLFSHEQKENEQTNPESL